jgi:hypothetical protein
MQSCCQQISADYQNFNDKNQIGQTIENQGLYQALEKTFGSWSSLFINQGQAISHLLVDTARYTEKELDSLDELIQVRKAVGMRYFKTWEKLEEKKNKQFELGYSRTWETNLD